MKEKRCLFDIGRMEPVMQLIAGLICTILIFIIAYPAFMLVGWLTGIDLTALNYLAAGDTPDMVSVRYLQVVQHISMFIIPTMVWSFLAGGSLMGYTGLNISPQSEHITLIVFISFLLIPVNSYASFLNSGLELPGWMAGVEEWIQSKEQAGDRLTSMLLKSETVPVLLINILILAMLPALGEELFFRGVLQRLIGNIIRSGHLTVVITAVIFSALHFQFYGFLPRFLLGLVYGYLFLWSSSVWLPVIAHFINNAVPVVLSWLYGWEYILETSKEFTSDRPAMPVLSFIVILLLLLYSRKGLIENSQKEVI